MYHYVEDKDFLKRARKACASLLQELEIRLREKGMNTQFFLIGSGARNMVTQNEAEPIDFDYNLNIISCEDWNDCKKIKETVRKTFNEVLNENGLPDCNDSTSALTTKPIYFKDDRDIDFSIDLAIVTKNYDEIWERLIHDKKTTPTRYFWNQAPNSNDYNTKSKEIKKVPGMWEEVREKYLDKKNMYLKRNDHYHPSFVCYIEAVNEIYSKL